ncbi:hypothetical protein ScPMuIL_016671 [Solemya velum]
MLSLGRNTCFTVSSLPPLHDWSGSCPGTPTADDTLGTAFLSFFDCDASPSGEFGVANGNRNLSNFTQESWEFTYPDSETNRQKF